jgi:hypothetical protein
MRHNGKCPVIRQVVCIIFFGEMMGRGSKLSIVHLVEELSHVVFASPSLLHQSMCIFYQIHVNIRSISQVAHFQASFSKLLNEDLTGYLEDVLGWTF